MRKIGEVRNPVGLGEQHVDRKLYAEPLSHAEQQRAEVARRRGHRLGAARLEELLAAVAHECGTRRLWFPGQRRAQPARPYAPEQAAPPPRIGGELASRFEEDRVLGEPHVDAGRGADAIAAEYFAREQIRLELRMHDHRGLGARFRAQHHEHGKAAQLARARRAGGREPRCRCREGRVDVVAPECATGLTLRRPTSEEPQHQPRGYEAERPQPESQQPETRAPQREPAAQQPHEDSE